MCACFFLSFFGLDIFVDTIIHNNMLCNDDNDIRMGETDAAFSPFHSWTLLSYGWASVDASPRASLICACVAFFCLFVGSLIPSSNRHNDDVCMFPIWLQLSCNGWKMRKVEKANIVPLWFFGTSVLPFPYYPGWRIGKLVIERIINGLVWEAEY